MCVGSNYQYKCKHYDVAYLDSHEKCWPLACVPAQGRTYKLDTICEACEGKAIKAEWDRETAYWEERLQEAVRLRKPSFGIRAQLRQADINKADQLRALRAGRDRSTG
ncbi:MAG: hypothetical protein M1816_008000 [Peltula sp. TS41687]|nr:MAG: hypothetical protein M1816_008000 [Peltula sp. TS41687]